MKISIALATYNGEAFLQDQLQSFEMQTRLPDEIIISDDNSTDKTLKILQNFKLETSIIVKIVNNNLGQGAVRNFNNALTHTSGDIILLSDQDDIWLPNKIEIY